MQRRIIAIASVLAALLLSAAACSDAVPAASTGATTTVPAEPAKADAVDITRDPSDVPAPIGTRGPQTVSVNLAVKEVDGKLGDGTTYTYWTFGGKVPGPMIRVRVGDTVKLTLSNPKNNGLQHNIDLHAVNGPGGGAVGTVVTPGQTKTFSFKALNPGVFVYHCATAPIPHHISNGMYGLIVVEPEGGLAPVDKEFYVMQGEIYTAQPTGTKGHLTVDMDKMAAENPTYVVFNGAWQALVAHPLNAVVGNKIRLFFGVGGPNLASNFHIIGEIMDVVHQEGATEESHNLQTTVVPPGGAMWAEFTVNVPGTYLLVDHALSRAVDKGALGHLMVTGPADPSIFNAPQTVPASQSGH